MTDCEADDLRLVQELCQGEPAAARLLYQRHGAALLRFGLAMTRSRHTAEDMVHDTFVEFLRAPHAFNPARGSVAAFLYGIARHQVSRSVRRADHALPGDDPLQALAAAPDGLIGVDEQIDIERRVDRVRRAVLDLPLAHREVVALCDLAELPYATVAAILDCPIGTVRSRLHRARSMLAACLDPIRETAVAVESSDVQFACRGPST